MSLILPRNYKSALSVKETEKAIRKTRDLFERKLGDALNLERASAPLFVVKGEGINDDLNGVERPVEFEILDCKDVKAQIVHSLAKWKRLSLYNYDYKEGEGIYTNMNAIRRDEIMDNIHSIYVDQWDWEKVIKRENRTIEFLKETVKSIVSVMCEVKEAMKMEFPGLKYSMDKNVTFITTQELEDLYPDLSPKERENKFVREHKTVFIMQIGDLLKSGQKHDGRAPDYDDWKLNGDLLVYNEVLDIAFELSSMGIRVDRESLLEQLEKADAMDRCELKWHKLLLDGKLPLSMGGGIGQSRFCMYILEKAHVGEVHSSIWPKEMVAKCNEAGIFLL